MACRFVWYVLLIEAISSANPARTDAVLECGVALIRVVSLNPQIYSGATPEIRERLQKHVGQLIELAGEKGLQSHNAAHVASVRLSGARWTQVG